MSHFYGSILGQAKTEATRRGSKASGLTAHIRTWTEGVKIEAVCEQPDEHLWGEDAEAIDHFHVYVTSGSNDGERDVYLGYIASGEWFFGSGDGCVRCGYGGPA